LVHLTVKDNRMCPDKALIAVYEHESRA